MKLLDSPGGKVGYRLVRTLDLPASFTLPDGRPWTPCLEPGELDLEVDTGGRRPRD
ncbi:hypothetical protein AB0L44_16665 [Nonomuraea wenchangensis]|uniref:hypothetical protein n=1 Tax=Nonomuraea wenchangensis TaxID=568860 RepID=UPI00343F1D9B